MNLTLLRRAGAATAVAALALPAAAGAHGGDRDRHGGHHDRSSERALFGAVASVDVGARQVVVALSGDRGWRLGHRHRSRTTTPTTGQIRLTVDRVKAPDRDGDGQSTLADVAVGDAALAKLADVTRAEDGTVTATASRLFVRDASAPAPRTDDDRCDDHDDHDHDDRDDDHHDRDDD